MREPAAWLDPEHKLQTIFRAIKIFDIAALFSLKLILMTVMHKNLILIHVEKDTFKY